MATDVIEGLSTQQVCEQLGVSSYQLGQWCSHGHLGERLVAVKGPQRVFLPADVETIRFLVIAARVKDLAVGDLAERMRATRDLFQVVDSEDWRRGDSSAVEGAGADPVPLAAAVDRGTAVPPGTSPPAPPGPRRARPVGGNLARVIVGATGTAPARLALADRLHLRTGMGLAKAQEAVRVLGSGSIGELSTPSARNLCEALGVEPQAIWPDWTEVA